MNKIFVDTNVFDELFRNGPAADDIAFFFEYVRRKSIVGCTRPKTLMDIYYLVRATKDANEAFRRLKQVYSLFEITPQTAIEVREAFALGWTDFEDAMQMASARMANADKIITLDKKFRNKDREYIWSPADLRAYIVQNQFKSN